MHAWGAEDVAAYEVSRELMNTANQLKIDVPEGISRAELCDLICSHTWRDRPASQKLRTLASEYGISVTDYAGRSYVHQRIFDQLRSSKNEQQLCEWFAYQVYQDLVGGETSSEVKGPNDPLITIVSRLLIACADVMKSITTDYVGADLVRFGTWTDREGVKRKGASRKTAAYKRAAAHLRPFATAERKKTAARKGIDYRILRGHRFGKAFGTTGPALSFFSSKLKTLRSAVLSHELYFVYAAFTCLIFSWILFIES